MSEKPRLLYLTPRLPFPPDKGDKIRSFHVLRHLCTKYRVSLGAFVDDKEDYPLCSQIAGMCERSFFRRRPKGIPPLQALKGAARGQALSIAWYEDRQMRRWVAAQRGEGLAAEVIFSSALVPYAEGARAPVLIDLVDADSAKWAAYGREGAWWRRPIYWHEAHRVAAMEARSLSLAAKVFAISPNEAAVITAGAGRPEGSADWFGNGIDPDEWSVEALGAAPSAPAVELIFTGRMNYPPNVEAVTQFATKVWPDLRRAHPNLTWGIVGADPAPAVTALARMPGITVTGRVADMRPYLAAATIAIAPLAIARGVQNKVLEAMAMERPVVASSGAAAGLPVRAGRDLLLADSPDEWGSVLSRLLRHPEERASLAQSGRRFVETSAGWPDQLARLDRRLEEVIK
ncbi:glycosyl transferase group 1 [Parvularcula bermudensis HTCC2503]|uniref:Glycosyl transferase group 1 n=1 Tax=Parvularcula bermudensis (strain ATCC BAA-594 / HTCC2503 / KCTC 12087) TaxID=314260 RepID=E0TGM8_PARBH|nr:TIGR03087 family PEP-CTERM/XrtA system glycosyltransferase [Parvularcula bermudensis]ADM10160.1 glycosyl transferase group 1 [Parvularcula bermudensis HTCC2503]